MPSVTDLDPADYLSDQQILDTLTTLANDNADICTFDAGNEKSAKNNLTIGALRIRGPAGTGSGPRVPVLVTGGVHAREWAPPTALVRFCQVLLTEAAPLPDRKPKPVAYAGFSRPSSANVAVHFPSVFVDATTVKTILQKLDLVILPLVNPDGYRFSRSGHRWWRKNLSSNGPLAPCVDPDMQEDLSVGTDINRNTDAAWHVETFYDPLYYNTGDVYTAMDPCGTPVTNASTGQTQTVNGESYRGQQAFSEPETRRVRALMDSMSPIFYLDVHSHGPEVQFGWGTTYMQGATTPAPPPDDTQNFQNAPRWDFQRNSGVGHTYEEFIPNSLLVRSRTLAKRMAEGIKKMSSAYPTATSDPVLKTFYDVIPSAKAYPTTGDLPDYLMKANYGTATPPAFHVPIATPARFPFTLECGSKLEGRFWPVIGTDYLKIERSIHLALWALLGFAASPLRNTFPIKTGT